MKVFNTHEKHNLSSLQEAVNDYYAKEDTNYTVSKSHLCNVISGRKKPSSLLTGALVFLTGIPLEMWIFPKKYGNPQIKQFQKVIKQVKKRKGRKIKP